MSENTKHLEETKSMLKEMKDIRKVEEINKDLQEVDFSDKKDEVIRQLNKVGEELITFISFERRKELEKEETDLLNQLGLVNDLQDEHRGELEALKEEKVTSEKKFKQITDHKNELSKEKESLEKSIKEQKEKFTENNQKIKDIFKEINSGKLSSEDVKAKKEEVRELKKNRISKENLLKMKDKLKDIEASINLIEEFENDPKKYFENLVQKQKVEKQPQSAQPLSQGLQEQQRKENGKPMQQGQWVWQPFTPHGQQNEGPVQKEQLQEPQNVDPTPIEPVETKNELTQIIYNDKTGKYTYTFSDGEVTEFSKAKLSDQLYLAKKVFKGLRMHEPKYKFFESLIIASGLDYNILKAFKDMGDVEGHKNVKDPYLAKYIDFIKGRNEIVKYSFNGFKLKDIGTRFVSSQRDKLVKIFEKYKSKKPENIITQNIEKQEKGEQQNSPIQQRTDNTQTIEQVEIDKNLGKFSNVEELSKKEIDQFNSEKPEMEVVNLPKDEEKEFKESIKVEPSLVEDISSYKDPTKAKKESKREIKDMRNTGGDER